jgi:acyl carrier protein
MDLSVAIARREAILAQLRRIIVEELRVPIAVDAIDADTELFGTGLGLDSIDSLQLVLVVESAFGIAIPEGTPRAAFRTVNTLADLVIELSERA